MGIEPHGLQAFLARTRDALPSVSKLVLDPAGNAVPWGDEHLELEAVRDLRLLQYDLLAGEGYSRGRLMR